MQPYAIAGDMRDAWRDEMETYGPGDRQRDLRLQSAIAAGDVLRRREGAALRRQSGVQRHALVQHADDVELGVARAAGPADGGLAYVLGEPDFARGAIDDLDVHGQAGACLGASPAAKAAPSILEATPRPMSAPGSVCRNVAPEVMLP